MNILQRPNSIRELAFRIENGSDFQQEIKDFLHQNNLNNNPEIILDEPSILAGKLLEGEKIDAYLAACAVYIARRHGWNRPEWTFSQRRLLHHPWFILLGKRIRNLLIMESPAEFRERNIFVSSNALEVL